MSALAREASRRIGLERKDDARHPLEFLGNCPGWAGVQPDGLRQFHLANERREGRFDARCHPCDRGNPTRVGDWSVCDRRFRRCYWRGSSPSQKVECTLFHIVFVVKLDRPRIGLNGSTFSMQISRTKQCLQFQTRR